MEQKEVMEEKEAKVGQVEMLERYNYMKISLTLSYFFLNRSGVAGEDSGIMEEDLVSVATVRGREGVHYLHTG